MVTVILRGAQGEVGITVEQCGQDGFPGGGAFRAGPETRREEKAEAKLLVGKGRTHLGERKEQRALVGRLGWGRMGDTGNDSLRNQNWEPQSLLDLPNG